jgi:23S rRNA (pseudouridine1915-N3)-methyltransferase
LLILAVGRWPARGADCPERDLFERYRARLEFDLDLIEVEERGNYPTAERRKRETQKLLEKLPGEATTIALDATGTSLTSAEFAAKFAAWRERAPATIAFLIGGADGFGPAIRERAAFTLSLGPMTWPHLMVRPMLLEQIYRAQQIRLGHPYHR